MALLENPGAVAIASSVSVDETTMGTVYCVTVVPPLVE
jgi:hypothetical protein